MIMIGDNLAVRRGGSQLAVLFGNVATHLPGLFRIETDPITHQLLPNLGLVTQDFFGTLVHSVSWWNSATWRIICKYFNIDADNVVEEKVDADDDDDCDDDDDDIANLSANLLGHGSTRRGRLVGALKDRKCTFYTLFGDKKNPSSKI